MSFDPIMLEVLWNRVIAAVDEEAATIVRTSFSPLVRESGDLAACVFDPRGRMVAQSVIGTPGHANPMSAAAKHLLHAFPPETLAPGDVLVTNDPWLVAGQLNDNALLTPVFRGGELVALFGSLVHLPDIGGRGTGAEGRSLYEEGLLIPPLKLYEAGRRNDTLYTLLGANVRQVERVLGDVEAQVVANEAGGRKLLEMIEEHDVSFDTLADAILETSERAMRRAISAAPAGTYHGDTPLDGFEAPITLACTVTVDDDEITVDFAGTSPQSAYGINVCLNYAQAYSLFAVRSVLGPEIPNNDGSLAPIHVTAPEGSLLNPVRPAPVSARHLVGMSIPFPVMNALAQAVPERVMSEGAGAPGGAEVMRAGPTQFGTLFFASGGMGARADKDGLSTTCYRPA